MNVRLKGGSRVDIRRSCRVILLGTKVPILAKYSCVGLRFVRRYS